MKEKWTNCREVVIPALTGERVIINENNFVDIDPGFRRLAKPGHATPEIKAAIKNFNGDQELFVSAISSLSDNLDDLVLTQDQMINLSSTSSEISEENFLFFIGKNDDEYFVAVVFEDDYGVSVDEYDINDKRLFAEKYDSIVIPAL